MTEQPQIQLRLPAKADGVAVVRQALAGVADTLALDPTLVADMKMAVTEACTNVVVHAYGETSGLLDVEIAATDHRVRIVVRDQGSGIRPRPAKTDHQPLGLGLPLIAALSDSFELRGGEDQGTEVRMTFALDRDSRKTAPLKRVENGWESPNESSA